MTILHRLLVGISLVTTTSSFSIAVVGRESAMRTMPVATTKLFAKVDDEKAIQCFIVNAFEVEEEGAEPEVVCTPEPEDYAWFNGLERDAMKPMEESNEKFLECVEGASPRGVPEWECKKAEETPWQ